MHQTDSSKTEVSKKRLASFEHTSAHLLNDFFGKYGSGFVFYLRVGAGELLCCTVWGQITRQLDEDDGNFTEEEGERLHQNIDAKSWLFFWIVITVLFVIRSDRYYGHRCHNSCWNRRP